MPTNGKEQQMNQKLYKYHGTIASMEGKGQTATEIVLYDMNDDDKAPARLSVGGGLARYIYEIEMTDAEEHYLASDWYFDRNLFLVRIEVPSRNPRIPAKIITQAEPWSGEAVIFGPQEYIERQNPEEMDAAAMQAWYEWRRSH